MALSSPLTVQPYAYIGDPTGRPLNKGRIYIGEANKDPEFYPIAVYFDQALTKEATQPIRTNNGFVDFAGDLAELYASEEIYSVKVLDEQGRKVVYKGAMMRNNLTDDALSSLNSAIIESQQSAEIALSAAVIDITSNAEQTVQSAVDSIIIDGAVTDSFVAATPQYDTAIARSQHSINGDTLNIRQFGDVENGQDAYDVIVKASKAAYDSNKTLIFNNGKTYISSKNFSFNHRINWAASGDSPDKPVIKITQEAGIGVKAFGSKQADMNLTSDINLWDSVINISSTAGVRRGQLLSVLSDTKWVGVSAGYPDTIKKGHLCLVDAVVSSTKIRLAEPINTRYLVATENIRLELHNPIDKPSINGIVIEKPSINKAAVGFEFEYCTNISNKNCGFVGAQAYGFQADRCYGGGVTNCYGSDAVELYQFSCAGSANLVYDKLTANRCAKTVDVTGLSIPARNNTIMDCIDNHGGVDAAGNAMHNLGTGFGTHWGAENTTFINCKTRNRYRGFYQRGLGDQYINCKAEGTFALAPFQLENPRNVTVLNCEYDSNIVTSKSSITDNAKPITLADYNALPFSFVSVVNTDGTNKVGQFSIRGCKANGVNRRLVDLFGDDVEFSDFEIVDNTFFIANTSTSNDLCVVETSGVNSTINNFTVDRNTLQTNPEQTRVFKLGINASASIKANTTKPSIAEGTTTYVMTLDNDTAARVFAATRNDGIEISIRVDSKAGYYGKGILYKNGTFDSFAQAKLYVAAGSLSGTTGSSSVDTIGIAISNSGVYVQNRTGAKATIILTVNSPV